MPTIAHKLGFFTITMRAVKFNKKFPELEKLAYLGTIKSIQNRFIKIEKEAEKVKTSFKTFPDS